MSSQTLPKISIVTISFNQANFLENCITSVLSQGYPNLEYIVVDPGSTDGSRAIISRYADRITRALFEADEGPADGLNKGFREATGHVFGYLNADDILLPGALNAVGKWFSQEQSPDVAYAHGLLIDARGKTITRIFSTRWNLSSYIYGACNIIQQSTFIQSEAFKRVGGFNTANRTCWDGELLVDLALHGARFERYSAVIGGFRMHSESITGSGRLEEQAEHDALRLFRKVTGKERSKIDTIVGYGLRAWKLVSHPMMTAAKLRDRLSAQHIQPQ